eukprot:gene11024-3730_t
MTHFKPSDYNGASQRGFWSESEDKKLLKAVNKYGAKNWTFISKFVSQRNGKQCRERYVNHLDPKITKLEFTPEEDKVIIDSQKIFGNSWASIAEMLQGRTPNSVKNHWYGTLSKKLNSHQKRKNSFSEETSPKHSKKNVEYEFDFHLNPDSKPITEENIVKVEECLEKSPMKKDSLAINLEPSEFIVVSNGIIDLQKTLGSSLNTTPTEETNTQTDFNTFLRLNTEDSDFNLFDMYI